MEAFELLAFSDDENGIVSGRQVLGLQIGRLKQKPSVLSLQQFGHLLGLVVDARTCFRIHCIPSAATSIAWAKIR